MKQNYSKILGFVSGVLFASLFITACASSVPAGAPVASQGEAVQVNAQGEPAEMTEEQRAAAIEANRKVRDCRKRQRSTGSRIAREACGNVTSIFGTGIHVRNENNVLVGAGQESKIPQD